MNLEQITASYRRMDTYFEKTAHAVGKFLDKHPILYKVVLVASHFFRSITMFGAMMWLPIPFWATALGMIAGSYLYRMAIERFCCFRFAIPSLLGSGSLCIARLGVMSFLSGIALASIGMVVLHSLLFLPLLGYITWVIYISHRDIQKRIKETTCRCS